MLLHQRLVMLLMRGMRHDRWTFILGKQNQVEAERATAIDEKRRREISAPPRLIPLSL
jgi:hypothetical protein